MDLTSGGMFKFDAVSADGSIVANISTSGLKTASGKSGSGKMFKVRSDIFFLLLLRAPIKLMLLTESDMYGKWLSEQQGGRVPDCIDFVHVHIPHDLDLELKDSRERASLEVSRG